MAKCEYCGKTVKGLAQHKKNMAGKGKHPKIASTSTDEMIGLTRLRGEVGRIDDIAFKQDDKRKAISMRNDYIRGLQNEDPSTYIVISDDPDTSEPPVLLPHGKYVSRDPHQTGECECPESVHPLRRR